jgi:hypothetical protein
MNIEDDNVILSDDIDRNEIDIDSMIGISNDNEESLTNNLPILKFCGIESKVIKAELNDNTINIIVQMPIPQANTFFAECLLSLVKRPCILTIDDKQFNYEFIGPITIEYDDSYQCASCHIKLTAK